MFFVDFFFFKSCLYKEWLVLISFGIWVLICFRYRVVFFSWFFMKFMSIFFFLVILFKYLVDVCFMKVYLFLLYFLIFFLFFNLFIIVIMLILGVLIIKIMRERGI